MINEPIDRATSVLTEEGIKQLSYKTLVFCKNRVSLLNAALQVGLANNPISLVTYFNLNNKEVVDYIKRWYWHDSYFKNHEFFHDNVNNRWIVYNTDDFSVNYDSMESRDYLHFKGETSNPELPVNINDLYNMFSHRILPDDFSFTSKFDTSDIKSMRKTFEGTIFPDKFLISSDFNTSSCVDVEDMFRSAILGKEFKINRGSIKISEGMLISNMFTDIHGLPFDANGMTCQDILNKLYILP